MAPAVVYPVAQSLPTYYPLYHRVPGYAPYYYTVPQSPPPPSLGPKDIYFTNPHAGGTDATSPEHLNVTFFNNAQGHFIDTDQHRPPQRAPVLVMLASESPSWAPWTSERRGTWPDNPAPSTREESNSRGGVRDCDRATGLGQVCTSTISLAPLSETFEPLHQSAFRTHSFTSVDSTRQSTDALVAHTTPLTRMEGDNHRLQPQQRAGQSVQQPTPQRLDRAPAPNAPPSEPPKVVQPTPQPLPTRSSGSSILVSPRQKGNPVLACLRSTPWEYSDILADYGLGLTTCALFLSLKYHRLHPEYIYTRIRNLQGKYNLRILLTLVDIPNHEDALRELSKTSVVNGVTVILAWSAAEAARYLELYKSYEHVAGFAAIRGQQASGYAERLVELVTVPRSVHKADAVALVGAFGSLRNAVNATPDQVAAVGGWGEKKVRAWCRAVEEPFRAGKAGKRRAGREGGEVLIGRVPTGGGGDGRTFGDADAGMLGTGREDAEAEADALAAEAEMEAVSSHVRPNRQLAAPAPRDDELSEGVAAALAKLREKG